MANLIGTRSADTVNGTLDDDNIFADSGNDNVFADDGNDYLEGGTGNDTFTGGPGADVFVFNSPFEGKDIIEDFSYAEGDYIQVSFGESTSNFTFSNNVLYYGSTALASLQPNSGFNPDIDINIL